MSLVLCHLTEYFGNFSEFQFSLKLLPSPPSRLEFRLPIMTPPTKYLIEYTVFFTRGVDHLLTGQHVLEFDGINRKDAGTYNVTASNKYGDEQIPCTLMVTENPQEAEDWAAQLKKT